MLLFQSIFLIFFLVTTNVADTRIEKAPKMDTCSMRSPNRNKCVMKLLQGCLPSIVDGSFGTQPLDPFSFDEVTVPFDHSVINAKIFGKNVKILGLKDLSIERVDIYEKSRSLHVDLELNVPSLMIFSGYRSEGTILGISILGANGSSTATIKDALLTSHIEAKPQLKNGKEYLKVISVESFLHPKDFYEFTATGISSFKWINSLIEDFFRNNGPIIVPEYGNAVAPAINQIMKTVANEIFSKVPYSLPK